MVEKFNFYAVYDTALEQFMIPYCAKNDKIAVRMFAEAKKQPNLFLDDLVLYHVGCFHLDAFNSSCSSSTPTAGNFVPLARFSNNEVLVESEVKSDEE